MSATAATPAAEPSDVMLDEMANAFLRWPLPESVCSDLCATKQGPGRVGTNLLSFVEAKQMFRDVLRPAAIEIAKDRIEALSHENTAAWTENEKLKQQVAMLRDAIQPNIKTLVRYAAECFPEVRDGQKHFVRVLMESVAEELSGSVAALPGAERVVKSVSAEPATDSAIHIDHGPVRRSFTRDQLVDFCKAWMRDRSLGVGCSHEYYHARLGLVVDFATDLFDGGNGIEPASAAQIVGT